MERFSSAQMCYFARYVNEKFEACELSLENLGSLLYDWIKERPSESGIYKAIVTDQDGNELPTVKAGVSTTITWTDKGIKIERTE